MSARTQIHINVTKILPKSYTILPSLLNITRQPVASGYSGDDVYEGTLSGSKVCITRIPTHSKDGLEKALKVYRPIVEIRRTRR